MSPKAFTLYSSPETIRISRLRWPVKTDQQSVDRSWSHSLGDWGGWTERGVRGQVPWLQSPGPEEAGAWFCSSPAVRARLPGGYRKNLQKTQEVLKIVSGHLERHTGKNHGRAIPTKWLQEGRANLWDSASPSVKWGGFIRRIYKAPRTEVVKTLQRTRKVAAAVRIFSASPPTSTIYTGYHSKSFTYFNIFNSKTSPWHRHYFYSHFVREETEALKVKHLDLRSTLLSAELGFEPGKSIFGIHPFGHDT